MGSLRQGGRWWQLIAFMFCFMMVIPFTASAQLLEEETLSFYGKVLSSDGITPIQNADVGVYLDEGNRHYKRILGASSDQNGDYNISGVPIGTFVIQAFDQSGIESNEYTVDFSGAPQTLDITMLPINIQGMVNGLDPSITWNRILLDFESLDKFDSVYNNEYYPRWYGVKANLDGTYQMALSPGEYYVKARAESDNGDIKYSTVRIVTVSSSGMNTIDFDVQDPTVVGRVHDSIGNPVPGVWMSVEPTGGSVFCILSWFGNPDSMGTFKVGGLMDGSYTLKVEAPGFLSKEVPINITNGVASVQNLEIQLDTNTVQIPVTGVNLLKDTLNIVVGQKALLMAEVLPFDATNRAVTWSSEYPEIASVDPTTGEITANSIGTTKIKVSTLEGGYTDQITINTLVLDSPQNVVALPNGSSQIDLSWTKQVGVGDYAIYRSLSLEGPYDFIGMSPENNYRDMSLQPLTTYYYKVTARQMLSNGFIEGPFSAVVSAKTEAYGLPINIAPNLPNAVAGQPYWGYIPVEGGNFPFWYSIDNLPSWLTLDTQLGELRGIPSTTDVGTIQLNVTVTDASRPARTLTRQVTLTIMSPDPNLPPFGKNNLATPLVRIGVNPSDGNSVGIFVGLKDIKDSNGNPITDATITGYQVYINYDSRRVALLEPYNQTPLGLFTANTTFTPGNAVISDIGSVGTLDYQELFFIPITLIGSAHEDAWLNIHFADVSDGNLNPIDVPMPIEIRFQRGKILNRPSYEGIRITDGIAGLQFMAGLRDSGDNLGQVNLINMASTLPLSDEQTIVEPSLGNIVAVMQYLAHMRDQNFRLIPPPNEFYDLSIPDYDERMAESVSFNTNITSPDLKIYSVKQFELPDSVEFFVDYESAVDRNISFFNPPEGDIFMKTAYGLEEGRYMLKFRIPRSQLELTDEATMKFWINGNPTADFIYFRTAQ